MAALTCAVSTSGVVSAFCPRTMLSWPRFVFSPSWAQSTLNYSYLPSCLLFYRNYTPLEVDGQGGFYTAHFWTLALEEHFYLIWPMLLIAVKPKRAGKVAFLLAMAVFAWRVLESHFQWFAPVLLTRRFADPYRHHDGCAAVGMPGCHLLS